MNMHYGANLTKNLLLSRVIFTIPYLP